MTQLRELPAELVCMVLSFACTSYKDAFNLLMTGKFISEFFNPATDFGRRLWASVRVSEGLPDGAQVGFTDYMLLRKFFSRGCEACDNHPRVRTPMWMFFGLRLCRECQHRYMEDDFPSPGVTPVRVHIIGTGWYQRSIRTNRHVALPPALESAMRTPCSPDEYHALCQFIGEMRTAVNRRRLNAADERHIRRDMRIDAVNAHIEGMTQPGGTVDLFPAVIKKFAAYTVACAGQGRFLPAMRRKFEEAVAAESRLQKSRVYVDQFSAAASLVGDRGYMNSEEHTIFMRTIRSEAETAAEVPSRAAARDKVETVVGKYRERVAKRQAMVSYVGELQPVWVRCYLKRSYTFRTAPPDWKEKFGELTRLYTAEARQVAEVERISCLRWPISVKSDTLFCTNCRWRRHSGGSFIEARRHVIEPGFCSLDDIRDIRDLGAPLALVGDRSMG